MQSDLQPSKLQASGGGEGHISFPGLTVYLPGRLRVSTHTCLLHFVPIFQTVTKHPLGAHCITSLPAGFPGEGAAFAPRGGMCMDSSFSNGVPVAAHVTRARGPQDGSRLHVILPRAHCSHPNAGEAGSLACPLPSSVPRAASSVSLAELPSHVRARCFDCFQPRIHTCILAASVSPGSPQAQSMQEDVLATRRAVAPPPAVRALYVGKPGNLSCPLTLR